MAITPRSMYLVITALSILMILVALYESYACIATTVGICTLEWGMYVIFAFFAATLCYGLYGMISIRKNSSAA